MFLNQSDSIVRWTEIHLCPLMLRIHNEIFSVRQIAIELWTKNDSSLSIPRTHNEIFRVRQISLNSGRILIHLASNLQNSQRNGTLFPVIKLDRASPSVNFIGVSPGVVDRLIIYVIHHYVACVCVGETSDRYRSICVSMFEI